MFEPVYRLISDDTRVDVRVSTGRYRYKTFWWVEPRDKELTNDKVFHAFNLNKRQIVRTSCHDKHPYEVYVTSNGDLKMRPPNSKVSVQIFHGVSFRNFAINEKLLQFDKLFFPGPYHFRQFINKGYLKEGDAKAELMGMPKLDCLVDGSIKREDVLRDLGLDPKKPVVLWCPTGAVNNSFDRYGKSVVDAVAAAGCQLILKLHDHPHGRPVEESRAEAKSYFGPDARLGEYPNVAIYLVAADLLLSDASSVAYEFTVRDKPIIFLDVPELLQFRAGMEKSNMDLETHGRKSGLIVGDMKELPDAIKSELANPERLSAERQKTANDIFYKPGTATVRMRDRLFELAGVKD